MQERRRAPRYRLDAAIDVGGDTGRTVNVSSNGVYFEIAHPFAPGAPLALIFPFEHAGSGASVSCAAEVVRVDDRGDGRYGVAATYEPIAFTVPA